MDVSRFGTVTGYSGPLRISGVATSRTRTLPNSTVTWSCNHQVSGFITLTQTPDVYYWDGTYTGTASISCQRTQVFNLGGFSRETWTGGPFHFTTNARAFLMLTGPGTATQFGLIYADDSSHPEQQVVPTTVVVESGSGQTTHETLKLWPRWKGDFGGNNSFWDLPQQGEVLSGTHTEEQEAPCGVGDEETASWTFDFSLSPTDSEPKLIIEPAPDYETWMPKGLPVDPLWEASDVPPLDDLVSLTPGNPSAQAGAVPLPTLERTVVRARLVGSPNLRAKRFVFRLTSSKVPGQLNNWPLPGHTDTGFDLVMQPHPEDQGLIITREGEIQVGKTPYGQDYTTAVIYVESRDYGAYGKVEITAEFDDRPPMVATTVDTNEPELRLPKRTPDSHIADVWKDAKNVTGLADSDDSESDPVGDGNAGDGLSLYEEYRGFREQGQHVQGDPLKKDYFLHVKTRSFSNRAAKKANALASVLDGVARFEKATGLNLHQLDAKEFKPSLSKSDFSLSRRVINFNHDSQNHLTDQHLVMLTMAKTDDGLSKAWSQLEPDLQQGTPKDFSRVEVATQSVGAHSPEQLKTDVAHELGHTVNIYHHGEGANLRRYWVWDATAQRVYERATPNATGGVLIPEIASADNGVVIYQQGDTAPFAPPLFHVLLSLVPSPTGNPYSGDEECIMRYNMANMVQRTVVVAGSPVTTRLLIDPLEDPGTTLCSDGLGKTFNSQNHPTFPPRHGDASLGRGGCIHQILVNDAVTPPAR